MKVPPLPKNLYEAARSLKVAIVYLKFSGGSDEGMLDIELDFEAECFPKSGSPEEKLSETLEKQFEDWAWEHFDYNGAGDGYDFGDDVQYNLVENTVEVSAWYMAPCDTESEFEACEKACEENTEEAA